MSGLWWKARSLWRNYFLEKNESRILQD